MVTPLPFLETANSNAIFKATRLQNSNFVSKSTGVALIAEFFMLVFDFGRVSCYSTYGNRTVPQYKTI